MVDLTPGAQTSNVETVGVSPKAVAATALSAVLSFALALLNSLNTPDGAKILGDWPPTLQFVLLLAVPPAAVAVGTYAAAVGRVALRNS